MPYVGNIPAESYAAFNVQHFTTSATTSYTLDHAVTNELDIRLVINNVIQQPGSGKAYTASGTTLTLSAATAGTDTMYCVYTGKAVQTVNPPAGSVGTSQLADSSVTNVKLGSDINATKLAAGLVPTARLGSGTASSSTVLYGDQTFKAEPSGGLTLLSMIDQDLGTANKIQFQQVFSSDYDYYKVIGRFNLGSASVHECEFRWLNSSNAEQTTASYRTVAQGWRYSNSAADRSDWGQWDATGAQIGNDIKGGSYERPVNLEMTLFPDAYGSVTYSSIMWEISYTKDQSGTEAVSRVMGYNLWKQTTDLSGGGMQLEVQNSYDFVTMGIYGVKTTT